MFPPGRDELTQSRSFLCLKLIKSAWGFRHDFACNLVEMLDALAGKGALLPRALTASRVDRSEIEYEEENSPSIPKHGGDRGGPRAQTPHRQVPE